jgi:hypothetical protein
LVFILFITIWNNQQWAFDSGRCPLAASALVSTAAFAQ